jgi:hypothetical protein
MPNLGHVRAPTRQRRSSVRAGGAPAALAQCLSGPSCSLVGQEAGSVPQLWLEPGRPALPTSWAMVGEFGPWPRF